MLGGRGRQVIIKCSLPYGYGVVKFILWMGWLGGGECWGFVIWDYPEPVYSVYLY